MSTNLADNRYMEFSLGNQSFALPLLAVKEVIRRPEVTSVPNMPAHFEGMVNLRGQILGVFNVRKKLGSLKASVDQSQEVVIVVEENGVMIGMSVDEVNRVVHASRDKILEAPLKEDDPAKAFISGVIHESEKLVLMVNVHKLLEFEKYKAA
jgi:purine-binding chemotaxis protein CheW